MRVWALIGALVLVSGHTCDCAPHAAAAPAAPRASTEKKPPTAASSAPAAEKVDFAARVRPILETRCTPCHFAGGTMYQRLPCDRPETINELGAKLFTRIKDENEQRLIRDFLARQSRHVHGPPP